MLCNIIAVERDGLDIRVITILCEVPNQNFDLITAAKLAATDFCKTNDGREIYDYNCSSFNWADFATSVPNEFCEKHGFRVIEQTCNDTIVDWDEHLVDDHELENEEEE